MSLDRTNLHHFPLYPAKVLAQVVEMTVEDRGRIFLKLLTDLIGGVPSGNPIADPMIEEAQAYYAKQRESASKGGRRTQAKRRNSTSADSSGASSGASSGVQANKPKGIQPKGIQENVSTEMKPKGAEQPRLGNLGSSIEKILSGGGGDKYEKIMGLVGEDAIANFTADFCEDADRSRAIGGYKRAMRVIGPEEFKSVLCKFYGSVSAGEDVPNRGGTFNKHYLSPAMEAKGKR